jgi:hypothetical protein
MKGKILVTFLLMLPTLLLIVNDVIGCSGINNQVCPNSWDCVISEREAVYAPGRDSCLIEIQDCGCWAFNC